MNREKKKDKYINLTRLRASLCLISCSMGECCLPRDASQLYRRARNMDAKNLHQDELSQKRILCLDLTGFLVKWR